MTFRKRWIRIGGILLLMLLLTACGAEKQAPAPAAQSAAPTPTAASGLETPALLGAAAAEDGITVRWAAVPGAAGYRVYRKYGDTKWAVIGDAATTSFTDAEAIGGTTYTYTVRCLDEDGKTCSGFDAQGVSAVRKSVAAPKLSSVEAVEDGLRLRWEAVQGAAEYCVYRKTEEDGNWTVLVRVPGTSCTDKTAAFGMRYSYTVCCLGSDGEALSGKDEKGLDIVRLETPTLNGVTVEERVISVLWQPVPDAQSYRVYRKTEGSNWKAVANVSAKTNTMYVNGMAYGYYYDESIPSGGKYTYTVRCISADGKTPVSYYDTEGVTGTVADYS